MKEDAFYQEDLASVHDQGYSDLSEQAAEVLLRELQRRGLTSGLVTDLGCGSGKLLEKLSTNGYETVGVDFSPFLIEMGKQRSPQIRFYTQSIWDYQLEPSIAVSAIGEVITYCFDQQNDDKNILNLFGRVYQKLVPNGVLLFDFLETDLLDQTGYDCKIVRQEGWTLVMEYFENKQVHRLKRDITLFRKMASGYYRRSREVHEVRLFTTSFIVESLERAGFSIRLLDQYNGQKLRDKHHAVLATKK